MIYKKNKKIIYTILENLPLYKEYKDLIKIQIIIIYIVNTIITD